MPEDADVVVIGAGQAGLTVSHELKRHGVPHLVLERGRVGETWRGRWKSFCLVLPNWTLQLPGGTYEGPEPDGYMLRDDLVSYLDGYAAGFGAPVREGVEVESVARVEGSQPFLLETSAGSIRARSVVLATGAYQKPHRPVGSADLPPGLAVFDADTYVEPAGLPRGGVLVVGSGQTGCQLAEELHAAGRDVYLACGRTSWIPRRADGRDIIGWLTDTPFFEQTLADLPSPLARLAGNPQASGRDGGHDLHYRTLAGMGVTLLGHYRGADDGRVYFGQDLAECVAFGDARYDDIRNLIRGHCDRNGIPQPELPDPAPFSAEEQESIDVDRIGSVIFTAGFRPDYARWVNLPGGFDQWGFPNHVDGQSTVAPGLFFVGVHFLRKRKSSLLFGVGEHAALVADQLAYQKA